VHTNHCSSIHPTIYFYPSGCPNGYGQIYHHGRIYRHDVQICRPVFLVCHLVLTQPDVFLDGQYHLDEYRFHQDV
jgi:hypothetical protein